MNLLTVKDVILTEYEKFTRRVEKYNLQFTVESMSNLELAGNLYEEMKGDAKEIKQYIKKVNQETNGKNKFRWYTILNIIKQTEQPAAELFEHPCSLPGTLISKICLQSKGAPISDEIYARYFNRDTTDLHPINLQCYYSVEYNVKDKIYYLLRDTNKSPRPEKKNVEKPEPEDSVEEDYNEEEYNGGDEESSEETTGADEEN